MAMNLPGRIFQYFLQLNLYKKSSDNEPSLLKDLVATRIYVIALVLLVVITALIAAFYSRTITSIEYSPPSTQFEKLSKVYPNTLHCPCSKFSVNYGLFVSLETKFHQVCSSEFIEQTWIEKVFEKHNQLTSPLDDHRMTLSFFWQIISDLCTMSNITWSDIITGFQGSSIISPTVVTEELLRNQIRETINTEQQFSQTSLIRSLRLIQQSFAANQYASSIATNFQLRYPKNDSTSSTSPKMFAKKFDNCSCSNINGCRHAATFRDTNNELVYIPGLIADCLIVDSTLQSTLECYYNETCISLLHESLSINIRSLSIINNKYFKVDSTVQNLFDKIMLDELVDDIQYDKYYSECNPSYCTYSYSRRFDILFVITTVIGLCGTFTVILRLLAPFLASIYLRWKNRHTLDATRVQINNSEQTQGRLF